MYIYTVYTAGKNSEMTATTYSLFSHQQTYAYRVAQKNWHNFVHLITIKYWPISKLFTVRIRRKFVRIPLLKIPANHKCRYTTLWNISVLKATIETRQVL